MIDIPTRLHNALRLPRTYRWVSDWLFTALSTPFHRNLTLPPPHLETAVSLHAQHDIYLPPNSSHLLPGDATKAVDIVFVPVALIDSVLVGYTFALSRSEPTSLTPHSNPFEPPFAGRFAFDTLHQDMLCVAYGANPPVVGLMSMGSALGSVREQATFAIPANDYSFENLPTTVLSMFSNTEYRVKPPEPRLTSPPSPLELIDTLLAPSSAQKSQMPWIISSNGRLADGGMPVSTPMSNEVASGVFSMRKLEDGVAALHDSIAGGFFGPEVQTETLHLLTGRYQSFKTGRIEYKVGRIGGRNVRDAFATSYFWSVLDVAPDARLMGEAEGGIAKLGWEEEKVEELGSVGSGVSEEAVGKKRRADDDDDLVPIAPKFVPAVEEVVKVPENETKEERSARLAVERRRRNRLSAARSNMRKKEELERVKKEIEGNWERVRELREREDFLVRENEVLKRLVSGVGGG